MFFVFILFLICLGFAGLSGFLAYHIYTTELATVPSVIGLSEEEALEQMIMADIDIDDVETNNGLTVIYGNPKDLFDIKNAISNVLPNVEFEMDEITMIPKDKITLTGEDLEVFKKLVTMLEDVEDVQHVYHNVNL